MKHLIITDTIAPVETDETRLVILFEGDKYPDIQSVYDKIAEVFDATDYFGYNLDALYDVLCDLSAIRQTRIDIMITGFECFLEKESPVKKGDFLQTVLDAIESHIQANNESEEEQKEIILTIQRDDSIEDYYEILNNDY